MEIMKGVASVRNVKGSLVESTVNSVSMDSSGHLVSQLIQPNPVDVSPSKSNVHCVTTGCPKKVPLESRVGRDSRKE